MLPLDIDSDDDSLTAIALCECGDQLGVGKRGRVEADFVGTGLDRAISGAMATIIEAYRSVFMQAQFPEGLPLILMGLGSIALLIITHLLFRRASSRFVEEL